jgi:hypothetical protein
MPTMQQKRGTASRWTSTNPVLLAGEIGFETDTKKIKIGDGTTAWNSLAYVTTDTEQIAYKHVQNAALSEWHIIHNLSFKPNVMVTDINNDIIEADIKYINDNEVKVTLSQASIGYAYLS